MYTEHKYALALLIAKSGRTSAWQSEMQLTGFILYILQDIW